ncbi:MAG: ParB/RepB/Spo0J family partition protein [Gammaproteobacteria bacterium]|jgi:ParB family chromosome partitioning protein|nr:chromosome partitioning protein ParB [Chromatiales bacterium]MCP4924400.1 ParB/RepB/Spo0J family partition protein [Gammaproteobacteria bacterium]MDP7153844.1 ParB/RepB/Spo0J family partition protein [Gammaproteobacteria bacterium]MDP7295844.1 ParB/RepB/Spo0J family partition protein [Gammaproteobacteria bacterium]MDP7419519.1 ParB/RepB/Spo0J family partition protein [Gammaproteobacteria bacterium]
MSVKRTGLGRGLEALLGDVDISPPPVEVGEEQRLSSSGDGLKMIAIDLLRRGTYQPRQAMDQDALEELADSIRAQGLIQPIIVRPLVARDVSGARRYEIVAGERRWRAAQLAGLGEIPAIVKEMPDSAAIAVALIENIQRENLTPLEESQSLRRLIDEFELTHQQAADAIGRSRTAVSNLLRLLDLGSEAKALVQARTLDMGHARALLSITTPAVQAEFAARIARQGLSVRATEALVKKTLAGDGSAAGTARSPVDPNIRHLQDELSGRLGAQVSIRHRATKGNGKVVVTYNSLDELEGILQHIK